ncbi:MAG: HAD-IIB family hydrolase [Actinomycetaceae bacterium]|nr:HAD-IIB family hydrolase [Actinomycetaceae bacterium]
MTYSLVAFDLDDTLAPSKSPLPKAMNNALVELLKHVDVCVISGANATQFRNQFLNNLTATQSELERLHIMPTCGTHYERFVDGQWKILYRHELDEHTRAKAREVLENTARELGLWEDNPTGAIIEDRGSQLTFSALGQDASLEDKRAWDPTGEKKIRLRDAVASQLPLLEVRAGGSTSVDITEKGIDKAYGMAKLVEQTGYSPQQIVFIGDRLDPAGNDYPVRAAGYPTIAVDGWEHTVEVIAELINSFDSSQEI